MPFIQVVLDFQIKFENFHNKFVLQMYNKHIKMDFLSNYIWIVMASRTFVYKHFCLSISFQTCYRDSIEHNIKGKKT